MCGIYLQCVEYTCNVWNISAMYGIYRNVWNISQCVEYTCNVWNILAMCGIYLQCVEYIAMLKQQKDKIADVSRQGVLAAKCHI